MPRRPEHLQLRGRIYWVRVRVPEDLRPVIGKLEVRRSLGTSDPLEAKRRVRIERIKIEAEFDGARQHPLTGGTTVSRSAQLSEEQVWALATRWFVRNEQRQISTASGNAAIDLEEGYETLQFVETWENVSHTIFTETAALLTEAGLPSLMEIEPAWRSRLAKAVHAAMVESERRQVNLVSGQNRYALNPIFRDLSAASILKPGATSTVTLAELIERFDRDPTRPKPSAKRCSNVPPETEYSKKCLASGHQSGPSTGTRHGNYWIQ